MTKYDDLDYHDDGTADANASGSLSASHIAIFLAGLIRRGLTDTSSMTPSAVEAVKAGNDHVKWPHRDHLIRPHPRPVS